MIALSIKSKRSCISPPPGAAQLLILPHLLDGAPWQDVILHVPTCEAIPRSVWRAAVSTTRTSTTVGSGLVQHVGVAMNTSANEPSQPSGATGRADFLPGRGSLLTSHSAMWRQSSYRWYVGVLGPGGRFSTDAELAAYAGVAPLETSSAGLTRHRLNRGGNRRLNAILYRIALTQARCSPEAKAYLARCVSEGKSRREAIRALKRFIPRAIWRLWQECGTSSTRLPVEEVA